MIFRILILLLAAAICGGCGKSDTVVVESESSTSHGQTTSGQAPVGEPINSAIRKDLPDVIKAGKVEFRMGEGEELFSMRPGKDGNSCKLYDSQDKELCKFTFSGGKLKAKTADDQPLFELKPKDDKLMIKDGTGEIELFKFKFKGDTIDFYLPGDKRVNRIKQQEYGWRLEDNADHTLFRAKSKDGKIVLRDNNDKTVLYSNDIPKPLGLVFFRIESLSFEQKAACAVFFMDR